jgi:hypothetical protein
MNAKSFSTGWVMVFAGFCLCLARAEEVKAEDAKQKWTELEAALRAAKEKELAAKQVALAKAYAVSPTKAEGIRVIPQTRAQVQAEDEERLRLELYSEAEIQSLLKRSSLKARLKVMWQRPDYDGAGTEHFKIIVCDSTGKVRQRISPDYRAQKQTGEAEYGNQVNVTLDYDPGEEFRVRVIDRNLKVHADFMVKRVE